MSGGKSKTPAWAFIFFAVCVTAGLVIAFWPSK